MSGLPKEYGWVILSGTAAWGTTMWMAMNVGRARKKYGVAYPKMYSDTEDTFNCIQRAHQNTLEHLPPFLFFLAISGTEHPKFAASCGALWTLARIFFAKGYYTGDPAKRLRGEFGLVGFLGLVGSSICVAGRKLEFW